MDSNPTATAPEQSSPPSLEELARRSARTILLPLIIGYASSGTPSDRTREVSVIVNPRTGSLTMIEGSVDVDAFLRGKDGRLPASKASIDAMPVVKVAEEGLDCAICLSDFEVGEEAKQMPCKHRYHTDCIDKWLGIQGSCPVCRYRMPVEEEERNKKEASENGSDGETEEEEEEEEEHGEEGGGGGIGRIPTFVFHIFFTPRRQSRRNSESESESESGEESESEDDNSDGSANTDQVGSGSQEMDIDT
ncbi:hypothetical protein ACH5RR_011186 [Cinchona calisaya]|uniref:RING-type E3 ubiquitin transferase n=1 Tax=Cinchona calisaya TaxID=153742 RepID=A0ABD3A7P7_9GENT